LLPSTIGAVVAIEVGSITPVFIGAGGFTVQNKGPGKLYVGGDQVTVASGVEVAVNDELPVGHGGGRVSVISASTSDVRVQGGVPRSGGGGGGAKGDTGETGPQGPAGADGVGGGGFTRQATVLTAATGDGTTPLAAGFRVLSVGSSAATTRLRVYRTAAARAADAARAYTAEPALGSGLICEYRWTTPGVTIADPEFTASRPAGESVVYFNVEGASSDITIAWIRTE
jgi:hypothetical protein